MIENRAIRNVMIALLIAFFFISVFFLGTTPVGESTDDRTTGVRETDMDAVLSTLEVHYLSVGKGDSILIKCGSQTMLIDGGSAEAGSLVRDYLISQDVGRLDYVVGTHFDHDHLDGLESVLSSLECGTFILPDRDSDTDKHSALMQLISNKGIMVSNPVHGESFTLGSAVCTVLAPLRSDYEENNDHSIVLRIDHGSNSFLFMADAQKTAEKEILKAYREGGGQLLQADVLKVSSHGGKNATGKEFLTAVAPAYAVLSCDSDDTDYPAEKVLKRLTENGTDIFRTDVQGTLVCYSNGLKLMWNAEPVQ